MVICSGASKRCGDCVHNIEHDYNLSCDSPYCGAFRFNVKCTETFEMIMKKIIREYEENKDES